MRHWQLRKVSAFAFSSTSRASPVTAGNHATWSAVPLGPPDAILGITEAFKVDPSPIKVNLGVGAYRDEQGRPYVLESVKKAEVELLAKDKEYAGIAGVPEFTRASATLAYGSDSSVLKGGRLAIVQSISGTGALRLGGEFLKRFHSTPKILLPNPTWGNHGPIFKDSGLAVGSYRYFEPQTNGLNLTGMLEDLKAAPEGSIVLLHACAHNPTGVDPTLEQWKEVSALLKSRNLLPFFDMAYQGFASGNPQHDSAALRHFVDDGHATLLCAQSYAKNFGLYGERVGALSVVCADSKEAQAVASQLKIIIRPMYSNPPIHGARIVSTILQSNDLSGLWAKEVNHMAQRIISMRSKLRQLLEQSHKSSQPWNHITDQIGMFCYTGLNSKQVEQLTAKHHVYLTRDGRISIAGITEANVEHLASAMHDVTK